MAVPFLRDGHPIGGITVGRAQTGRFTESQIRLLQSFADQAVIAIENTRLFESEHTSKRELRESLEYQTATSEVLGAISRTPTELQPVLAEICKTANRLCETPDAAIFLQDGKWLRIGSVQGSIGAGASDKIALTRGFVAARTFLDREVVHVHDLRAAADEYPEGHESSLKLGHRTIIGVPLMRNEDAIGVLILRRSEVKPFTDKQIQLLKTFADQAVIAIENTRLLEAVQGRTRELTEALEYQTATSEVLNVISRSPTTVDPVFDAIVSSAATLCGAAFSNIQLYDGERLHVAAMYNFTDAAKERFRKMYPMRPDRLRASGRAILTRAVVHVPDALADPKYPRELAIAGNWRALLSVPMLREGKPLGVVTVAQAQPGPFSDRQIDLVKTFADQAVIAIENARLFDEIAQKSRELEIAGQHKSQFVANMSHELRTPLAAMLGYAELLQEGIYGELPEKSLPILARIRSNGKHLLGLINTVLDISKIEAGQFKLNIAEYALGSIVETVMVATESLAATKKLAFKTEVAKGLPYGLGDEQRLTQVLLNLVGNAIKFTDAGEVRIAAGAANGHFTVSVSDTGPGIPSEECERIFEKFRQVDSSNTRAKGGTGLGLAIAREIVEMHGGRIWVESTIGQGSTFRMELPVRAAIVPGEA
jgi:signal transduction histidine kinase